MKYLLLNSMLTLLINIPLNSYRLLSLSLSLLKGASPDGLIRYIDGSIEVLEVKCSSPFTSYNTNRSNSTQNNSSNPSSKRGSTQFHSNKMTISNRPPPDGIGVWHIPQLQLEILCAGPKVC